MREVGVSWKEGRLMARDTVTLMDGVKRYTREGVVSWEEGRWMMGDRVTWRQFV